MKFLGMAVASTPTFEHETNWQSSECLTLDFSPSEIVHRWKRMPECDEFVGARCVSYWFAGVNVLKILPIVRFFWAVIEVYHSHILYFRSVLFFFNIKSWKQTYIKLTYTIEMHTVNWQVQLLLQFIIKWKYIQKDS